MKKTALLLLLILPIISVAQETKTGFSFSVKGGLTLANMYGEDVQSETFLNGSSPDNFYANHGASNHLKAGMNFGGVLDYRFGRKLSLGIGTSYIQKGDRINATTHWNSDIQDFEPVDGRINWIQNYLTLDVPLKIYFPVKESELYLQGGPSFSKLFNSKEKGTVTVGTTDYTFENNRGANDTEPGFFLGAGYLWSMKDKPGDILIEFIWNRTVGKSYGRDLIPHPQYYYNQTFSLNVGYRFNWYRQ